MVRESKKNYKKINKTLVYVIGGGGSGGGSGTNSTVGAKVS